jgi:hypothetical protein
MKRVSYVLALLAIAGPVLAAALYSQALNHVKEQSRILELLYIFLAFAPVVLSVAALITGWRARLSRIELAAMSLPLVWALAYIVFAPAIHGIS